MSSTIDTTEPEFPSPTAQDWAALLERSLKGRSAASLTSRTLDGIDIKAVYPRARDLADTLGQFPFTRANSDPGSVEQGWVNRQHYTGLPIEAANRLILDELPRGVSGVHIELGRSSAGLLVNSAADLQRLLEGVHLSMIDLSLGTGEPDAAVGDWLQACWQSSAGTTTGAGNESANRDGINGHLLNFDPLGLLATRGSLSRPLADSLQVSVDVARTLTELGSQSRAFTVDTRPWHNAGASEAQELALMLAAGKQYLQAMLDQGLSADAACRQISIHLVADADYFLSATKLRSARTLWARFTRACGASGQATELHAVVSTSERMLSWLDPWVNILRTTVAAAAAAIGGAQTISVTPFDTPLQARNQRLPSPLARRIARNIPIILQQESSLHRVLDPLGGSGYIEHLTDALCEQAWQEFRLLEQQGSLSDALQSGHVQQAIAARSEQRQQLVDHRQISLIGVNDFPALEASEVPDGEPALMTPAPVEATALSCEPLAVSRPAESFERLRERLDQLAAASGYRPAVYIAALGSPAEYSARVQFSANLLAAAGIAVIEPEGKRDEARLLDGFRQADTDIAIVCVSAKADPALADSAAEALRQAGCRQVLMAGPEPAERDKHHFDDYLFQGCNAQQKLARLVEQLEANQ